MFVSWRRLDLMYESGKVSTGSAGVAAEGRLHVLVRLFRNSETRLKIPLGLRVGQHIKTGMLFGCAYDFSKKLFYQIGRRAKEVVHCSN